MTACIAKKFGPVDRYGYVTNTMQLRFLKRARSRSNVWPPWGDGPDSLRDTPRLREGGVLSGVSRIGNRLSVTIQFDGREYITCRNGPSHRPGAPRAANDPGQARLGGRPDGHSGSSTTRRSGLLGAEGARQRLEWQIRRAQKRIAEAEVSLTGRVDAHTGATTDVCLMSRRKRHALHSVRQDYGEVVYLLYRASEGCVLGMVGG